MPRDAGVAENVRAKPRAAPAGAEFERDPDEGCSARGILAWKKNKRHYLWRRTSFREGRKAALSLQDLVIGASYVARIDLLKNRRDRADTTTESFFRIMRSFVLIIAVIVVITPGYASVASAASKPATVALADSDSLNGLAPKLVRLANETPGMVAISVVDLTRGYAISINGDVNLPAASTIKVPVMAEVMRQIALRKFTFERTVSLRDSDRDCGYGSLCEARWGSKYTVWQLLWSMITVSDNTAANMLIRLVGRQNVNKTMQGLGLTQTWLGDSIHSDGNVRQLRTSANDMMRLLGMIAEHRLINDRADDAMLEILAGQRHNTMLPAWLPKGVTVAHKTGTLHDTLNDIGIVELDGSPYVICVFATHLSDLDVGERFIRRVSLLTFRAFTHKTQTVQN
jgi:beta-lactamase class A